MNEEIRKLEQQKISLIKINLDRVKTVQYFKEIDRINKQIEDIKKK